MTEERDMWAKAVANAPHLSDRSQLVLFGKHEEQEDEKVTDLGMPGWLTDYNRKYVEKHGDVYPEYRIANEGNDPDSPVMRDVAFNRHSKNDGKHVSPYDEAKLLRGVAGLDVELVQGVNEDAMRNTLSRAIRATNGINIHEPYEPDDWEEMLQGGLQTALESQVIVFGVQGASRALTHQIVRSRRAAFHQQSQRATWMGFRPNIRIPETVAADPVAKRAFIEAAKTATMAYNIALDQGVSYENARYILPEGTTNYILCEYSLREFMNFFAYRGCSMFMTEMVYAARRMRDVLLEAHPWLAPYVKITCEKTKVCEFQGWETVEGQCDFPWAREDNRRFKSERHAIK